MMEKPLDMSGVKEEVHDYLRHADEIRRQTDKVLKENQEKLTRWDYLSKKKLELHEEYRAIFKRWYLRLLHDKCDIVQDDWIQTAFDEVEAWRSKHHDFTMESMKDEHFRVDLAWENYRIGIIAGLIEMRQHLNKDNKLELD